MKVQQPVFILDGARTPMCEYEGSRTGDGRPGGAFGRTSALELGGVAAAEALKRSGVAPDQVDQVIFGNVMQTSGDALYGARHVGLKAGVPIDVPALTVNRLCGSGIQALMSASEQIMLGEAKVVLAGGTENMSQSPHVIYGARAGFKLGQGKLEDSLMLGLLDTQCNLYMAQTAENLATKHGVTREEQDQYALRSQTEAFRAQESGLLGEEIVPVEVRAGRKTLTIDKDDHLMPQSTIEGLAKLRAAFSKEGTVTAGNASGIVDGAASLVIADEATTKSLGKEPLGRITAWHVQGVEPSEMGIGPVPAIKGVLEQTGLTVDDIDLFEINEAFAAQYLSVERALELNRDKVNVNGGAIALGHPLGATGSRLVLTLTKEMKRRGVKRGIASACIGGGQGIALLVER
ncbi:MAG: thiolase family protein [Candidatus Eisenbacteria bacterium]|uniref:Thiolase family protein n=1 Tax=Eiseniibacteriota bacterium TaxID=2212470 RepID=A0A7Y2H1I6_UNCEI|nr:thiolase family protein [Candidatus Eisenbacteria bacterium]